jgi:hypothetical protein
MPGILDKIAAFIKLAKTFGNAELLQKSSELSSDISNLKNENNDLKDANRLLQYEKDNPLAFNEADGLYYEGQSSRPCCPGCYEANRLRVHLTAANRQGSWTLWECPKCKASYHTGAPPQVPPPKWDPLA